MSKINIGRVIVGGIVAGIVSDLLGYLVDGLLLAEKWSVDMIALGRNEFSTKQLIEFNLLGIVSGIIAIWIYAGIRPRFGAGVKTAIYAGIAVWIVGVLLPNAGFMYVTGLFSRHLTLYTTLGGLVEVVAGTVAGAALYKED
jgi:hypothetical protein